MTESTKSREELIAHFSNKAFSGMLQEILIDTVLQSHKEIVRTVFQMNNVASTSSNGIAVSANGSPGIGTNLASNPTGKDKTDGNIYFECTNCQKKIASNRYAPHLSGCLGIGTGSRRGAARNASAKNRLGPELERGASPAVSDYGSPLLDTPNSKGKSKAKGSNKKSNGKLLDGDNNGNHKRSASSVEISPSKKVKKQKTGDSLTSLDSIAKTAVPLKTIPASWSPTGPPSPSVASGSQYSGKDSPGASISSLNALSPNSLARASKTMYRAGSASQLPSKKHGPPIGAPRTHIPRIEDKEDDTTFIDVDGEEQDDSSSNSSD